MKFNPTVWEMSEQSTCTHNCTHPLPWKLSSARKMMWNHMSSIIGLSSDVDVNWYIKNNIDLNFERNLARGRDICEINRICHYFTSAVIVLATF
jgi:hypothetical protein